MRTYIILLSFFVSAFDIFAQTDSTSKRKTFPANSGDRFFNFNVSYALQIPKGDLEKRFTTFSQLGFGMSLKTHRNFNFGVHGSYMWGGNLRETDVLQNIRTSNGMVIDKDGGENRLAMKIRGYSVMGIVGKIIPFNANKNAGFMVQAGGGYFDHRIAFKNFSGIVTQLQGDYLKGYERRAGGALMHIFLGYHSMNTKFYSGFYTGVSVDYARTAPFTNIDYSTGTKEMSPRNDLMIGLRFVWMIPIPLTDIRDYGDDF